MVHRMTEMSIERHNPDLIINIPHDSAKTFDFYKAKELIEIGQNAAKKSILKFNEKQVNEYSKGIH